MNDNLKIFLWVIAVMAVGMALGRLINTTVLETGQTVVHDLHSAPAISISPIAEQRDTTAVDSCEHEGLIAISPQPPIWVRTLNGGRIKLDPNISPIDSVYDTVWDYSTYFAGELSISQLMTFCECDSLVTREYEAHRSVVGCAGWRYFTVDSLPDTVWREEK